MSRFSELKVAGTDLFGFPTPRSPGVMRQMLTGAYRGHGLRELEMVTASQVAPEKNKEAAGGVACVLWILTGIYYFGTTPQAYFISWQALLFFVGGAFASALVIGAAGYYAIEAGQKLFYRPHYRLTARSVFGAVVNLALNILQLAVPILAARSTFQWLFEIN